MGIFDHVWSWKIPIWNWLYPRIYYNTIIICILKSYLPLLCTWPICQLAKPMAYPSICLMLRILPDSKNGQEPCLAWSIGFSLRWQGQLRVHLPCLCGGLEIESVTKSSFDDCWYLGFMNYKTTITWVLSRDSNWITSWCLQGKNAAPILGFPTLSRNDRCQMSIDLHPPKGSTRVPSGPSRASWPTLWEAQCRTSGPPHLSSREQNGPQGWMRQL